MAGTVRDPVHPAPNGSGGGGIAHGVNGPESDAPLIWIKASSQSSAEHGGLPRSGRTGLMHQPAPSAAPPSPGCDLERRVQALGADAAAARWIGARVETYFKTMLRRFRLSPAQVQRLFPLEVLTAEARCARCGDIGRCRRFLAGAAEKKERPAAFCPNARLFGQLRQRLMVAPSGDGPLSSRRGR
jgi:hypothetical protein